MGTIIKRKKSYQAQVSSYKNGKQNRITATFLIKAEAKQWIRKMESLKDKNIKTFKWSMTFTEYYEDYIYNVKKHFVRESTFENYKQALKFIKAYAPNLEVRHLCYENVQTLVNNYAENRAKRTAKDFLDKIKPAISHAHATNLIEVDFSRSLHSTGYDTDERNVVLSFAEYKKLKTFVQTNYNELNTFIYVILETGMRRGECLGLRPEYITKNEIHVRESISPTTMDTSLKNKTAYRTIPIKEEVYNRLMSLPVNDDGFIFDKQFDQSKKLKKILRKLGITGTTIHGLRSTFASIIYSLTKDELYTTKLMGHKDFSITKEYYLDIPDELNNKLDANVKHFMSSL